MNSTIFGYLLRFFIFSIPFFIWVMVVSWKNDSIVLSQNETESNLQVIPKNQHFEYVFLGASQSRTFTRESNFEILDDVLGEQSYLNLSSGGGAGVLPALHSMKYFYDRGNTVEKVIVFVHPRAYYSRSSNENHPFFTKEPFHLDFFLQMIVDTKLPWNIRKQYIYQVWNGNGNSEDQKWIHEKSGKSIKDIKESEREIAKARLEKEKSESIDEFDRYFSINEEMMDLVETENGKVIYIFLPCLMDDVPGKSEMEEEFRKKNYNYTDLSDEMQNLEFYYDYMHFNRQGVEYFFKNHFKKLI